MYKAHFELGWQSFDCECDTLDAIYYEIQSRQNLNCLIMMGQQMGDDDDRKELARLQEFIDRWENNKLTEDDFRDFNYELSIGSLECTEFEVISNEEEDDEENEEEDEE